jgi:uncharacterized protein YegJ (DUF2314 family)
MLLLVILINLLFTIGILESQPPKEYLVPAGEPITDVVEGVWGWQASKESSCRTNPHTIRFTADGKQMLIGFANPDSTGVFTVYRYDIQEMSRSRVRGQIVNEKRRTSTGTPVVWDLVLTGRDRYRWHRADWSEGAMTGTIVRCDARTANSRLSGYVVQESAGSSRALHAWAKGDTAREAAVRRARATASWFLNDLSHRDSTSVDAPTISVLAPVIEGDRVAFVWLNDVVYDEPLLRGKMSSDPAVPLTLFKRGDENTVAPRDLIDWLEIGKRSQCGGFTQRDAVADTLTCRPR